MSDASSVFLKMNRVHDAMNEWCQHKGRGADEQQARKEGVRRSEQLACGRRDRIDRPHATKDHRGVHKSVYPRQATEEVIAEHANPEGDPNRHGRQSKEPYDSPEKAMTGQKWIGTVFKHARYRISPNRHSKSGGTA